MVDAGVERHHRDAGVDRRLDRGRSAGGSGRMTMPSTAVDRALDQVRLLAGVRVATSTSGRPLSSPAGSAPCVDDVPEGVAGRGVGDHRDRDSPVWSAGAAPPSPCRVLLGRLSPLGAAAGGTQRPARGPPRVRVGCHLFPALLGRRLADSAPCESLGRREVELASDSSLDVRPAGGDDLGPGVEARRPRGRGCGGRRRASPSSRRRSSRPSAPGSAR